MTSPIIIDLPHSLGRDEARRRMAARVDELPAHIPGGMATVTSSWPATDRLALRVVALGQTVDGTVDVEDRRVRVTLLLPPSLSFLSSMIAGIVRKRGDDLLLEDSSRSR